MAKRTDPELAAGRVVEHPTDVNEWADQLAAPFAAGRTVEQEWDALLIQRPELNLALGMLGVKEKVRDFVVRIVPLLLATEEGREILAELGYRDGR